MCRLFGIIANKEVDINYSFFKADRKSFKELSKEHPDGWGIGWFDDGIAKIFKQGAEDVNYEKYQFDKAKEIRSKIIISHVRKATQGDRSTKNAHPFKFKNWLFAHNGSVKRKPLLELLTNGYAQLISDTDSEVYFHLIIQEIENAGEVVRGIKSAIKKVKNCGDYTGLNFIMSDGKNLYAYRDAAQNESYYSLDYLERDPQKPFEAKSKETKALLCSKALANEKAILVCSEKLSQEDWNEIDMGTLIIVNSNLKITCKKLMER